MSFVKSGFLVKPANFAPVVNEALSRSWSPELIRSAFKKTGILSKTNVRAIFYIEFTEKQFFNVSNAYL